MMDQATKEKVEQLIKAGRRTEANKLLMDMYGIDSPKAQEMLQGLSGLGNTVAKAKSVKDQIFSYLVGPLGLILLAYAGYSYYSDEKLAKSSTPVVGKVIELKESVAETIENGKTKQRITYAPVIEYTVDGKQYTHESKMYGNPPLFELGADAPLLVDPNDPSHIIINSFFGRYLKVAIIGVLGLLFSGIGIKSIFSS